MRKAKGKPAPTRCTKGKAALTKLIKSYPVPPPKGPPKKFWIDWIDNAAGRQAVREIAWIVRSYKWVTNFELGHHRIAYGETAQEITFTLSSDQMSYPPTIPEYPATPIEEEGR